MRLKYKIIAVDFDGTIAEDGYFPKIGPIKQEAIEVLSEFKVNGGKLIIWTCRTGGQAEAVKHRLELAGIEYDAFNDNLPEIIDIFPDNGRKIFADVYIDDRANFCEEINWNFIRENLYIKE